MKIKSLVATILVVICFPTLAFTSDIKKDLTTGLEAALVGNYLLARKKLEPIAKNGNVDAQYFMGLIDYEEGKYIQSFNWQYSAAHGGRSDAQYELGGMYLDGIGTNRNITLAIKWLRKSAEQLNADAQYDLGVLYYEGNVVRQNYKKALVLWKFAASAGHLDAQTNLGLMYLNGFGVTKDTISAYMWISIAAGAGHKKALANLPIIRQHTSDKEILLAEDLASKCIKNNFLDCS